MSSSGGPLYGGLLYGGTLEDKYEFFKKYVLDCIPPAYIKEEFRDFWERFLWYSINDLAFFNDEFDRLAEKIDPTLAPENWLDWMISEWWGWRLIPEGYPLARKRRLLRNLHAHVKRRGTVGRNTAKVYGAIDEQLSDPESGEGIKLLLREFGIIAEVYDRPLWVGGFIGSRGSRLPLNARVIIHGYEPFVTPRRVYVGGFIRKFMHTTRQIITERFVQDLLHWSRPAGVRFLIEWRCAMIRRAADAPIVDDDSLPFP